jgi:uncharacterized protein YjbI with pentapeptide repeats
VLHFFLKSGLKHVTSGKMASDSAKQKLRDFGILVRSGDLDGRTDDHPAPRLRGDSEDFSGLDLSHADFGMVAKLERIKIEGDDRTDRVMRHFPRASFRGANFSGAYLPSCNLSYLDLTGANFAGAHLEFANLSHAIVRQANFSGAVSYATNWTGVDLSEAIGLEDVVHRAPSIVDGATLRNSRGKIPRDFLLGAGMNRWEIAVSRLYDPSTNNTDIAEALYQIFDERVDGPLFLGGVFISYSHKDERFAELLRKELLGANISTWRDVNDLVAGPLEQQVFDQIRISDAVVVVLSENSCESDWVTAEIEKARKREKEEDRQILCPIALDATWKSKVERSVSWRPLKDKNVISFPKSKSKSFDEAFAKLRDGLNRFYARKCDQTGSIFDLK